MARKHTVGPRPAYRQARPFQMPHRNLQNTFIGAVVDGQRTVNRGDFNIPHNAGPRNVEQLLIGRFLLIAEDVGVAALGQRSIVVGGRRPNLIILVLVQLSNLLGVARNGAGLVERVPVIAE